MLLGFFSTTTSFTRDLSSIRNAISTSASSSMAKTVASFKSICTIIQFYVFRKILIGSNFKLLLKVF